MKAKIFLILFLTVFSIQGFSGRLSKDEQLRELQKEFQWWPTDAQPGPVRDERGGYWWWPKEPGEARPWGNRGYIFVHKIIYDYKADELPPPEPGELRPSLLVKKILRNVKIYFDFDKSDLRKDHIKILEDAARVLRANRETDILITGNCDVRGSIEYNYRLGRRRAASVQRFLIERGISEQRIRMISRGKLDAVAPVKDIKGMQRDRNAHFIIAEVEEIMLPAGEVPKDHRAIKTGEETYIIEERLYIESAEKVFQKEYTVKKGDTLWKIAKEHLGDGNRWRTLYNLNKARIRDPNKLKPGTKITIVIE